MKRRNDPLFNLSNMVEFTASFQLGEAIHIIIILGATLYPFIHIIPLQPYYTPSAILYPFSHIIPLQPHYTH